MTTRTGGAMNKAYWTILTRLWLWGLLLTSCSSAIQGNVLTATQDQSGTVVALTVAAELTQISLEATSTPLAATPTLPAATPVPLPTNTPPPTETPLPTPTPLPCDQALFVEDIRVRDGTIFPPGRTFVKTWRLKNTGVCPWTTAYALVFVEGDQFGASSVVPLPAFVFPGETIDLSVNMTAPEKIGEYRGYWQLRNADGLLFGVGSGAQRSIWVDIAVKEPLRERAYNFATTVCEAEWESSAGELPCPGDGKNPDGFVIFLEEVRLENRAEDEPTLWIHPEFTDDGWIAGTYPPFNVQEGDRFQAWVGCLASSEGCEIEFRLGYVPRNSEAVRYLREWQERYDEAVTVIDLDLSALAGERVQFVLYTRVRQNPLEANGFWFVPEIKRIEYFE